MADDTSYATFLHKANEDPNSGARPSQPTTSTSQARAAYDPSTSSAGLPTPLQNLPDTPYVSDTDSDWVPVFLSYASDELPSLDEFKAVLRAKNGSEGERVEELSVQDFDPQGQYTEIVGRVREAGVEEAGKQKREKKGGGEQGKGVKVFRVEVSTTRVEYYVLTVGERKLVGVVAKAVES